MTKVNVIFLDIDGVLNSKSSVIAEKRKKISYYIDTFGYDKYEAQLAKEADLLDQTSIGILSYITKQIPGCKIIIHSTWSKIFSVQLLEKHLRRVGLEVDILGTTPKKMSSSKFEEINWAVENFEDHYRNYKLNNYVIIENDKSVDKDGSLYDNFHLVDDTVGLSYYDIEPIVQKFKPGFKVEKILV